MISPVQTHCSHRCFTESYLSSYVRFLTMESSDKTPSMGSGAPFLSSLGYYALEFNETWLKQGEAQSNLT